MSFASDSLAKAQAAYHKALDTGQEVRYEGRLYRPNEINALLEHVNHWQAQVDAENARAAGRSARGPMRFNL